MIYICVFVLCDDDGGGRCCCGCGGGGGSGVMETKLRRLKRKIMSACACVCEHVLLDDI